MSTLLLPKKSGSTNTFGYYKTEPSASKMWAQTPPVFDKLDLDTLTDYIASTHHSYARENAVVIYDLVQEVANKHGERHPELFKLTEVAFLFFHDLLNHLKREQQILFPNIRQLFKNRNCKETMNCTTFGLIRETVTLMKKEHLATCKDLKMFHKLTHGYLLPADACYSYKYLFKKMKEFENDLVSLINLENNILFARAIALCESLQKEEKRVGWW